MSITIIPIGIIKTPFNNLKGMPIQPSGAVDIQGTIIVNKEYEHGLSDLEGFSHIILLYHFHQSQGYNLMVTPFMDNQKRGLFSTRAPKRPNPIGLSIVQLIKRENNKIIINLTERRLLILNPMYQDLMLKRLQNSDGLIKIIKNQSH